MKVVVYATWIPGKFKPPMVELIGEDFARIRRGALPMSFELSEEEGAQLFALLSKVADEYDTGIRYYQLPQTAEPPTVNQQQAWKIVNAFLEQFEFEQFDEAIAGELPLCWAFVFKHLPASFSNLAMLVDKHTGMVFFRRYVDIAPHVEGNGRHQGATKLRGEAVCPCLAHTASPSPPLELSRNPEPHLVHAQKICVKPLSESATRPCRRFRCSAGCRAPYWPR